MTLTSMIINSFESFKTNPVFTIKVYLDNTSLWMPVLAQTNKVSEGLRTMVITVY